MRKRLFGAIWCVLVLLTGCTQEVEFNNSNEEVLSDDYMNLETQNVTDYDSTQAINEMVDEIYTLDGENSLGIYNEGEEDDTMERQPMILGLCASYREVERPDFYSLEYFRNLDDSYTYYDVLNDIGEPNGGIGSGIVREYWQVEDKYILLRYGLDGTILKVEQCNQKEVEEILYINEEFGKK